MTQSLTAGSWKSSWGSNALSVCSRFDNTCGNCVFKSRLCAPRRRDRHRLEIELAVLLERCERRIDGIFAKSEQWRWCQRTALGSQHRQHVGLTHMEPGWIFIFFNSRGSLASGDKWATPCYEQVCKHSPSIPPNPICSGTTHAWSVVGKTQVPTNDGKNANRWFASLSLF